MGDYEILEQTTDLLTIAEQLGVLVPYDDGTTCPFDPIYITGGRTAVPHFLQDEGLDPDNRYIDDIQTFLGDKDRATFSAADRAIASLGPCYSGNSDFYDHFLPNQL